MHHNPEQQTPSTQLNLMSALREENLVKDTAAMFAGMEPSMGFSGLHLQNKVMEAIPELAKANHGFQAQFQPAFMHPLLH